MGLQANRRISLSWVAWAITFGLLTYLFRVSGVGDSWAALRSAKVGWLLAGAAITTIGITLARVERMRILVGSCRELSCEGSGPPGFVQTLSILSASRFLNLLLPARAGESLRAARVRQSFGVPIASAIAAIGMETSLDALTLAIPAAGMLLFGLVPAGLARPFAALVLVGATLVATSVFLHRRRPPSVGHDASAFRRILRNFLHSIQAVLHSPAKFRALACTLVADFLDVSAIYCCFRALGINLGIDAAFLVLCSVNLAIVVPTPGNFGTLEAGAVLALDAQGVAHGPALAFALLYHFAHLIPVIAWGAWALPRELRESAEGLPLRGGRREKRPSRPRGGSERAGA